MLTVGFALQTFLICPSAIPSMSKQEINFASVISFLRAFLIRSATFFPFTPPAHLIESSSPFTMLPINSERFFTSFAASSTYDGPAPLISSAIKNWKILCETFCLQAGFIHFTIPLSLISRSPPQQGQVVGNFNPFVS